MNEATNYAGYVASQLSGVVPDAKFGNLDSATASAMFTKYKLGIAKERLDAKLEQSSTSTTINTVEVNNVRMDTRTCMAICGNGGLTSLPSAARAARFFGYVFQEMTMYFPCPNAEHDVWKIGDSFRDGDTDNMEGKIVTMYWKKSPKGLVYPALEICKCTGIQRVAWVRFKMGKGKPVIKKYKLL